SSCGARRLSSNQRSATTHAKCGSVCPKELLLTTGRGLMSRSKLARMFTVALLLLGCAASARAADFDYRPVFPFAQLPPETVLGAVSGVAADSRGSVYILQRQKPPILSFDRHGKFVRSFGDSLIGVGHGLAVDADDNVWATCTEHHMVYKFSPEG